MTKRRRLTNLDVDEVSFVDAGANPQARVVLTKRDPEARMKSRFGKLGNGPGPKANPMHPDDVGDGEPGKATAAEGTPDEVDENDHPDEEGQAASPDGEPDIATSEDSKGDGGKSTAPATGKGKATKRRIGKAGTGGMAPPPDPALPDPMDVFSGMSEDQKQAVAQMLALKDQEIANLRQMTAQNAAAASVPHAGPGMPAAPPAAPVSPAPAPAMQPAAPAAPAAAPGAPMPPHPAGAMPPPHPAAGAPAPGQPHPTPPHPFGKRAQDDEDDAMPLPEDVKKKLEQVDALQKALNEEREIRKAREYADEASRFTALPMKREELAKALRAADEAGEEAAATIRKALRAADAASSAGVKTLAKRYGAGAESTGDAGGSPMDQLNAMAAEFRKADPKLSKAKAFTKALEQRPDLYAEYEVEKRRNEHLS